MKKYYAKRLIEKTEINVGDFVTNEADLHKHKATKLFLCSKNIEEGNEFIHETNADYSKHICKKIPNGGSVVIGDNDVVYMKSYCYAVLGPISGDAKWVMEKDEFDDDEIEILKICHDDSNPPYDSYCSHCQCSSQCLNDEGNYVRIKSHHCGHFH